ncbi:MAG: DMT family transporter [Thermoleophilia bacterium]|nr:DMT family transporter [Thermoleophilia bacterium]
MTRPLKGYALVLGSALLLGTLGVFSKLFYDAGGEPFTLLFLRFAAGGPLLVLIALARREQWPPLRGISLGASLGVLQLLVAFALFEGFARAPVGLVVLVFFCYPLIVAVAAAFLFGEELGPRRVRVLALGTAGVALTVGLPDSANTTGIALGLLAGICVAGLVVSARALTTTGGIAPLVLCGLMFTSPLVVLVPISAARGVELDLGGEAWLWAAGAVVVSVVIPIALFYTGVQLAGAGAASILGVGEPLAGVLLAYLVLSESLTWLQLLGGLLIVAAVVVLSWQATRPAAVGNEA